MMEKNPLKSLESLGQSVWLDYLSRDLLDSGTLAALIEEDGISGVTSNPAIFEKAINGGDHYDEAIEALTRQGRDVPAIYRALTLRDVRDAADLLRPVYERTGGGDGFVSLEVSPHLAHDAEATVAEARDLWQALDRPNVMIKVPGTRAGLPAFRQLTAEGVNVNVTLLFSLARYAEVCEAWLAGLEDRAAAGRAVDHVASVASFFLSRIDTLVDPMLPGEGGPARLRGEAAIASARLAYRHFREVVTGERFRSLAGGGARVQRLLWASTSTKNPDYPDTKYVEPLIGPDTVNTMPMETIDAFRDHGNPDDTLEGHEGEAEATMAGLREAGIDMDAVVQQLEDEGVQKFIDPYDKLFDSLEQKCRAVVA